MLHLRFCASPVIASTMIVNKNSGMRRFSRAGMAAVHAFRIEWKAQVALGINRDQTTSASKGGQGFHDNFVRRDIERLAPHRPCGRKCHKRQRHG